MAYSYIFQGSQRVGYAGAPAGGLLVGRPRTTEKGFKNLKNLGKF